MGDPGSSQERSVYLQGFADLGIAAANNERNANSFRLNLLVGAGFNDWLFIGAGPGIRLSKSLRSIPLMADIRIGNLERKIAFFGALGGGLSMGSKTNFEYIGPAGHAEIGLRFNNDRKGGFIIFVGYEVFSAEMTETVRPRGINTAGLNSFDRFRIVDIKSISIGIGYSFL